MSQVENLITQHLDIWTQATEAKSTAGRGTRGKINLLGIQKLRELILEMAVRGLLVPQDPNDEPASELLKKIAAEKAQLIKDGKIKKSKPLPEITDDEKPFELPKGWEWVRLGEVGNVFNGNSINERIKKEKYTNVEGLPFIATKDVGYGFEPLNYDNGVNIPAGEPKFVVAHSGAVLICAEGGSAGKKCGITDQDICFGNKLFVNEPFASIDPKFILAIYLSPSFYEKFSEVMTGIIGGISRSNFINLPLQLPPLDEQTRIVAKVDELMALCDALETQTLDSIATHQKLVETLLGNLVNPDNSADSHQAWLLIEQHFDVLFTTEHSIDTLKQTILQLAFDGRLVKWDKYSSDVIKNCLDFGPRNGFSPPEVQEDTGVFVLKLGATSYGVFNPAEVKNVKVCIDEDSHLWVQKGDILVQRGNSKDFVGSNLLIEKDIEGTIYPDLMMKLRTSERVIPEYLSLSLSSIASRQYMWDRMTGTSGTMPKISKKVVESVPVNIPCIVDQNKTVSKIRELFCLCDQIKTQLQPAQTTQAQLAQTITQEALA